MKKRYKIFLGILMIILLGTFFFSTLKESKVSECQIDSDCVPSSCCHAQSCVPVEQKQNCSGIFCTAVCSGPLDCGQGSCGCIKNKCGIIQNE